MESVLAQFVQVPGVIGSFLCDADGHLTATALPDGFEDAAAHHVARTVSDGITGLATATGAVDTIDLKFQGGRLLARAVGTHILVVLCAPSANQQFVSMMLAASAGRLGSAPARR